MSAAPEAPARLRQLALQFLVHCFLYYRLGEPVISDERFDALVAEFQRLRAAHPGAPLPHQPLVEEALGPEGSGFRIRDYPPEVISAAFKVLYAEQGAGVDFREFVERRGYRVEVARDVPA